MSRARRVQRANVASRSVLTVSAAPCEVARVEHHASPDLSPEPGWLPIDAATLAGRGASFVSGAGNGNRVRVRYFTCEPEGTLAGKVWFGADAEGRPGHVHPGSLAAVLEEAMGLAAWLSGHPVVALNVTAQFRDELPVGLVCTLGSWISSVTDQRVHARALIAGPSGQTCADAEGVFAVASLPREIDGHCR